MQPDCQAFGLGMLRVLTLPRCRVWATNSQSNSSCDGFEALGEGYRVFALLRFNSAYNQPSEAPIIQRAYTPQAYSSSLDSNMSKCCGNPNPKGTPPT